MSQRKASKPAPRAVTIDSSQSLGRVGIVALVGFVVGIAWPRLAGVSLVPEAPVEELEAPKAAEEALPPEARAPEPSRELAPADLVAIGEPKLTSCRDSEGKKVEACGKLDTDSLVHGVLLSLAECPGAKGAFGTLSLGFDIDFQKKKFASVVSGKSTNVPDAVRDELLRCAKDGFATLDVTRLSHEHASYTVFYVLEFKRPEEAVSAESTVTKASGTATVRWQTALVRESPSREADVVARLLSGARVIVTGKQGDWYRVKYDDKGREAWLHGASLGM